MKLAPLSLLLFLVAMQSLAIGDDHFLTIGGGYSPTGNQVSLEKNVIYFRSVLRDLYGEEPAHQILFSDGKSPGRDLQFVDPNAPLPRVNELLAKIHRQTKNLTYAYRDHEINDVYGASSKENLNDWFEKVGASLGSGDRLFIYATAHGGKAGDKNDPTNTKLYLWNRQSIDMHDMARWLDKVDPQVSVVLVMVQCYSGGFADLVFDAGMRKQGAANANRCGFFATVHDRVAAGCTPDIREESYHEYSTYFWAALSGKTRTGSPVERPDYDGDGNTSLAEAHAYALIQSTTIDISIKTSDAFLRQFSRTEDDKNGDLLSRHTSIERLLEVAAPHDRAVIEQLSKELELASEDRAGEAERLAGRLKNEKQQHSRDQRGVSRDYGRRAESIKQGLLRRWPELSNPWNPAVQRLLTTDAEPIINYIEQHAEYERFTSLGNRAKELKNRQMDCDRRWVKCQRLIRTLENVALAENLKHVADPEVQQRFHQLVEAETQTIGSTTNQVIAEGSTN